MSEFPKNLTAGRVSVRGGQMMVSLEEPRPKAVPHLPLQLP